MGELYLSIGVFVCEAGTRGDQNSLLDALELKLQAIVNPPPTKSVLRTKLKSSARTVHGLKPRASSPAPSLACSLQKRLGWLASEL